MMKSALFQRFAPALNVGMARLRKTVSCVAEKMSLSIVDIGAVPTISSAMVIEKGVISYARATKHFSQLSLQHLENVLFAPDAYPTPNDLASVLTTIKDTPTDSMKLVVPKAWVVVRVLDLPLAAGGSLATIIPYEMDRFTPYTSEEVFWDYRVIESDEKSISVLLLAAKKEVLQPYLSIFEEHGISLAAIGVDLLDIGLLVASFDPSFCICLRLREATVEGCILNGGRVVSVFEKIGKGRNEADFLHNDFLISAHCQAACGDQSVSPRDIAFLGTREEEADIKKDIDFPVKRFTIHNLNVTFPENISAADIRWSAIAGAVVQLTYRKDALNLLHRGEHTKKTIAFKVPLCFVFAIVLIGVVYSAMPLYFERKKLQEIDGQIAARRSAVNKVELLRKENDAIRTEIGTITDFKGKEPLKAAVMKELTSLLPKSVWLIRLRISENLVEMEGYAKSGADVLSKLSESPFFQNTQFVSPPVKDPRTNGERFSVKAQLSDHSVTDTKRIAENASR